MLKGLGNVNDSEDHQAVTKKKFKKMTKTPNYLMGTANSRAKTVKKSPTPARRTKSPMNTMKSPINNNKKNPKTSPMSKT